MLLLEGDFKSRVRNKKCCWDENCFLKFYAADSTRFKLHNLVVRVQLMNQLIPVEDAE
jgi:hypothetical protein